MTEFTDQLIRQRLMDPEIRQAYHTDAHYHAEWMTFGRALDAAHRALVEVCHLEADRIVEALSMSAPDLDAAHSRIALARARLWHTRGECTDRGSCELHAVTTAF